MADGSEANGLAAVGQLAEDPKGTDPQRVKAAQLPPQGGTGKRVTLEQAERVLDRVDERQAQLEQVATRSPGEDESGQGSAGGRTAPGKLGSKLGEGDGFALLDLGKPGFEGGEGPRVGKDLRGLLQRLVLADRNQSRGGGAVTRDRDDR